MGFNAAVLYRELQAQGYVGSYPSLVRYLRPWRQAQLSESTSTVRFETDPGEQAQVDWGSAWVWLGEERVRVHVFTMVLGYSRRIFARGYPQEGLEALLEGHARAFEHFGGCTQTVLYDNPRTIARRPSKLMSPPSRAIQCFSLQMNRVECESRVGSPALPDHRRSDRVPASRENPRLQIVVRDAASASIIFSRNGRHLAGGYDMRFDEHE